MPSIIIKEIDETSAGLSVGTDVVYVIGMATSKTINDCKDVPTLFESLETFRECIGNTPYTWAVDQDVAGPSFSSITPSVENAVDVDATNANVIKFISKFNSTCLNLNNLIYPSETPVEIVYTYTVGDTSQYWQDDKGGPVIYDLSTYGIVLDGGYTASNGDTITLEISYSVADAWSENSYVTPIVSAGTYDLGYVYAAEVLGGGLPVVYYAYSETDTLSGLYQAMDKALDIVADKGEFSPKYITSGGYPVLGYKSNVIASKMIEVAVGRGDAVALIDHTNNRERALTGDTSVYAETKEFIGDTVNGQFGALFTPWATYATTSLEASNTNIQMPGSFAYCTSLAQSVKTNANWLAIAGVARGLVSNIIPGSLNTKELLTNTIADSYQKDTDVSINAITNIRPYGLTIWGNRTLKKNTVDEGTSATSFLNLRNLVNDVKKIAYTAAKSLMFEQNTDILWINFKSKLTPTLDRMTSGQGLSGYKIIKETTSDRTKVKAKIILYPVYAVEKFEITVIIRNEDIEVA